MHPLGDMAEIGNDVLERAAARELEADAASGEASVSAQGSPRANSSANEGPESAPQRALSPSTAAATWCGSSPLPSSKPLHNQTTGAAPRTWWSSSRSPATGVAASKSCDECVASRISAVTFTVDGSSKPGR